MAYLVVMVLALLVCGIAPAFGRFVARTRVGDHGTDPPAGRSSAHDASALAAEDLAVAEPAMAEAELAARLLAGLLPAAEYQRAMAELAAVDDDRDPVVVPPEHS